MDQITRARGVRCGDYKESCLRRRLAVRMRARGALTFEDYARVLRDDSDEYERLLNALTINVTKFYRNAEMWNAVAARFLPVLWRDGDGAMRCWSAGCASGEEPYTLAVLLLEEARRQGAQQPAARVDATDFDRGSLDRAIAGSYRTAAFEEMPEPLVRRYFTGDNPRSAGAAIRALVSFREHDLLRDDPPASSYDLIMCRNVVIYFDRPTQERLFLRLTEALRPGGVLVLGKVETMFGAARDRLVLEDTRERIYRRG